MVRRGSHSRLAAVSDEEPGCRPGQQTGSKRLKSAWLNHAERNREKPKSRMNRAIPRQSSSTVVTLEPACHAGGRGFESRRSRKIPANRRSVVGSDAKPAADYTDLSRRTAQSDETGYAAPDFKPTSARVPAATNQACDYTKRPEVTLAPTGSPPEEKRFLADAIVSRDESPTRARATGTRRKAEHVA
jgi:hypothetical protein